MLTLTGMFVSWTLFVTYTTVPDNIRTAPPSTSRSRSKAGRSSSATGNTVCIPTTAQKSTVTKKSAEQDIIPTLVGYVQDTPGKHFPIRETRVVMILMRKRDKY